jgi:hypothetical protein
LANQKAEKEKATAQQKVLEESIKAKVEETKGKTLAQLIQNKMEKSSDASGQLGVRSFSAQNPENELMDLAAYAQKLYPELGD